MKNTDIKNVFFANNGVIAVFYGDNLLWRKQETNNPDNQLVFYLNQSDYNVYNDILNAEAIVRYYGESNTTINGEVKTVNGAKYLIYNFNNPVEYLELNSDVKNAIYYCGTYFNSSVDGSHWNYWTNLFENSQLRSLEINLNSVPDTISFESVFNKCYQLYSVTINPSAPLNISSIYSMFANCNKLEEVNIDNYIDFSNATSSFNFSSAFYNCSKLTTFNCREMGNIYCSLDLSKSPLDNDSAMLFINGLGYVDNETISFKSSTYNELTEEQIALATSKGWTVTNG